MSTGPMIAAAGRLGYQTGLKMLEGIKAERFARLPVGNLGVVPTNHPAWVFGHLGLYGPHLLTLLGHADDAEKLAAPKTWDTLFGMGSTCQDDPAGDVYPSMNKIVEQFERSYDAALKATQNADDAVFMKINPNEKMRDRFPTVGTAVTFMLTTHPALHLGQVSAWRRIEGLGSALGF